MKSAVPALLVFFLASAASAANMHLRVAAGDGHGHVRMAHVYTQCGGKNMRPAVRWQDAPPGTRSFALTTFDPDANHGAGWWHWIVLDLPASVHHLGEHTPLPVPARSLRNDFGHRGWDGPCPPAGDPPHHYVFTLYALDVTRLPVARGASPDRVRQVLRSHALARSSVTLLYAR